MIEFKKDDQDTRVKHVFLNEKEKKSSMKFLKNKKRGFIKLF